MLILFLLLALPLSSLSQVVEDEPWEPGEETVLLFQRELKPPLVTSPLDYLMLRAISYYQRSLSGKSVSRCPFEISCSQFAAIAIRKYGLLGYAIFIDRYFYRENPSIYSLYIKKVTKNGVVKLDDKIYLFPFKYNNFFIHSCRSCERPN